MSEEDTVPKMEDSGEAEDDDLFGEKKPTTEVSLDDDNSTEISLDDEPSAETMPAANEDEILETPPPTIPSETITLSFDDGKDEDELLEEESGDAFEMTIKISEPTKVGDGMSAYMAYNVTTNTTSAAFKSSEFAVKRRFSDFLGLHERLNETHLLLGRIVPPPPDKSVVGMVKVKGSKEDQSATDFTSRRQNQLEQFLNRISRHPQLRDDPNFKEFLEAEELPRAKNTSTLSKGGLSRLAKSVGNAVSKITTKMEETDPWFEEKQNQVETLDLQMKKLHLAAEQLVVFRKETSVNTGIFAKSLSLLSNSEEHTGLSRALSALAEVEERIEQIQTDQSNQEFRDVAEALREYLGLIVAVKASFEQRAKIWKGWQDSMATLNKKREALVRREMDPKQKDKIGPIAEEVKEWERRVEKGEEDFEAISKEVKVEMARFEKSRVVDFKDLLIKYLQSLLKVQEELLKVWEGFAPEARQIQV